MLEGHRREKISWFVELESPRKRERLEFLYQGLITLKEIQKSYEQPSV